MRSDILVVLLAAAMASARPMVHPDRSSNSNSGSVETRELQYAEIEAMYIERDRNKARQHHAGGGRMPHHHEDVWLVDDGHFSHHDDDDHHHRHGDVGPFHGHHEFEEFEHPHDHHRGNGHHGPGPNSHEFEEFGHPHDHHHGGPHNGIVDNILGFLTHQVRRSLPDASGRVLEGIRDFLSHETRDVHEHEHHGHRRGPSPRHDIGRHILDFFASATR